MTPKFYQQNLSPCATNQSGTDFFLDCRNIEHGEGKLKARTEGHVDGHAEGRVEGKKEQTLMTAKTLLSKNVG